jgi:hypothetical protein
MNQLLIEVNVPSIGSVHDVFVPMNASVRELLPLIATAIKKLSHGYFSPNNPVLCDGNTGIIYKNDATVETLNLANGSKVILI